MPLPAVFALCTSRLGLYRGAVGEGDPAANLAQVQVTSDAAFNEPTDAWSEPTA